MGTRIRVRMTENKMPEMMVMASGVKSASPLAATGIKATIDVNAVRSGQFLHWQYHRERLIPPEESCLQIHSQAHPQL